MRNIVFHPQGWEDFTYWATADKKMLRRLLRLIEEARRTPFEGAGKPEPLRRNLSGFWSRRIDDEHRLVYGATEDEAMVKAEVLALRVLAERIELGEAKPQPIRFIVPAA